MDETYKIEIPAQRTTDKISDMTACVQDSWIKTKHNRKMPNNFIMIIPCGVPIVVVSKTVTYTIQVAKTETEATGAEAYVEAYVGMDGSANVSMISFTGGARVGSKRYVKREGIKSSSVITSVSKLYSVQEINHYVSIFSPPRLDGYNPVEMQFGWRIKHKDTAIMFPKRPPNAAYWPTYNISASPMKGSSWRLVNRKLEKLNEQFAAEEVRLAGHLRSP